jgi:RNA polymerase sigma factor (sigma-70 family)
MDDLQLLRAYVQHGDQDAFGQFIARHIHWVHSAACREVRDPHLADDVTQATFILLAQKAPKLLNKSPLAPWLFKAMRYVAANAIRMKTRRRRHEQRAAQMTPTISTPPQEQDWDELSPHLNTAVAKLPAADRTAILLRFFQNQSFLDVAAALKTTEAAAKKRVSRAILKLRQFFISRNITLSADALSLALLANTTHPAPPALLIATTSTVCGVTVSSSPAVALATAAAKSMALAKLKLTALLCTTAILVTSIPAAIVATQIHQPSTRSGTSAPTTQALLNEVLANHKSATWVHARNDTAKPPMETWIAFRPYRQAIRYPDRLEYLDDSAQCSYLYDPAIRTITIEPGATSDPFFQNLINKNDLLEMFVGMFDYWQQRGAKLTQSQQTVDGKAIIFLTLTPPRDRPGNTLQLRIDATSKRVLNARLEGPDQPVALNIDLDYPAAGPADIYALGAPRDARIIDLRPSPQVLELDKKVEAAKQAFAPTYYAIICATRVDPPGSAAFSSVHVVYKRDGKYRIETYSPQAQDQTPPADLPGLEAWIAKRPVNYVRFILSPESGIHVSLDAKRHPTTQPLDNPDLSNTVEGLAWNEMSASNITRSAAGSAILVPPNPADAKLVLRQHCWHGLAQNGKVYSQPNRVRQFFDPQRDYLRHRYEFLIDAQGDWQRNKNWLKDVPDDPDLFNYCYNLSRTILEYAQTPTGRWYPTKIQLDIDYHGKSRSDETSSEAAWSELITIHLDTARPIPEALLDPARLDPAVFQGPRSSTAGFLPTTAPTTSPRAEFP